MAKAGRARLLTLQPQEARLSRFYPLRFRMRQDSSLALKLMLASAGCVGAAASISTHPMVWLRLIAAASLLVLCAAITVANVVFMLRGHFFHRHSSLVPLFGGAAGAVAVLLLPYDSAHFWWWLPLLLDVGCVPLHLAGLVDVAIRRYRGR
jgi:hypothetical protein